MAARVTPSAGGTVKVGYALSTADIGRLDRGIWTMRPALRTDPDSLHYLNKKAGMKYKIAHLINRYEKFKHCRT